MNIALTAKSSNAKVGKIPVTTSSRDTCPSSCPLINNGCYASAGFHTRMHWDKVTAGERGTDYDSFLDSVRKLKPGQLWRHNVAGDLQGADNVIDTAKLGQLAGANKGKRGFTYTHYPMTDTSNRESVRRSNDAGFTVNASCNTPADAIDVRAAYKLPTVTIVPSDYWVDGNKQGDIVRCPAEYRDSVTCETCKLCSVADRDVIVGFTAHGTQSAAANIIARA
jgi:hypothetical protein